jgi:cyclohexa-1,5-dienecarbonyl-CoA hydratase
MNKLILNNKHNSSVAEIILNSPKANILDIVMMKELTEVLTDLKSNKDLKAITIEGAGEHFCFGASVEEHKKDMAAEMLKNFHRLFYLITDIGVPSIAKISGQCIGGGLELALVCNLLFADKSAKLGQPEIMLGVFPPPASLMLPLKIGSARAEELLITGRTITAEEAHQIGLLNKLYESKEEMSEGTDEFIDKYLLPKSASSLRYAVKAARTMYNQVLNDKLKFLELLYVNELMNTADANEGINSFIEKRKPIWKNN